MYILPRKPAAAIFANWAVQHRLGVSKFILYEECEWKNSNNLVAFWLIYVKVREKLKRKTHVTIFCACGEEVYDCDCLLTQSKALLTKRYCTRIGNLR
jgi:hypothetical protein